MWVTEEESIRDGISVVWNGIAATFFEKFFTN